VGKDFPLFVTWWQFVVALAVIYLGGLASQGRPELRFFAPIEFRQSVAVSVAPVTVIFIGMVVFNNLCLKYVEVSFYQTARSLSTVFSVVLTWLVLHVRTSLLAVSCCGVVVLGFGVGSAGEVNFSLLGWGFGIVSSLFVALYGIYVKKALIVLNNDSDLLLVYNTILSIVFLIPLIVVSGEVQTLVASPVLQSLTTWIELTVAGVFGLLINIATYLQIQHTSALTHNISGTVKACLQTVLGIFIYQNAVSFMAIVGIVFVIGGSAAYTYVRKMENDAKEAAATGGKQ
jgi:GDP-fucose transporter C1